MKSKILSIPKLGTIGFHPAELPANRGRHPIIWALVLGLKKTASTFFYIDEGIDSGPIIMQSAIQIDQNETENSLSEKILVHEHKILPQALQLLCSNKIILEGRKVRIKSD